MKKILVTLLIIIIGHSLLPAQQIVEDASAWLQNKNYKKAKELIDEAFKQGYGGPRSWYTKSKIYAEMANQPETQNKFALRSEAFQAFQEYLATDKEELITLKIEAYRPINAIYTGFYGDAANAFNQKNYADALRDFENALTVSTLMYDKGWIQMKLDTNSVLYAGVSAEKLNRLDVAVSYYGYLAESKVKGAGFVEIYKWVANYYYEKKQISRAEYFIWVGKGVYPEDPFWSSLELDIARSKGNKEVLFAQYEKTIAANPNNHLYRYNYAVELYQYAYNTDISKRPSNNEVAIKKASEQINGSLKIKPDYMKAQLFAGQIIYNQGIDIWNQMKAVTGTTEADLKKKNDLKSKTLKLWDEAIPYFLAVEKGLGRQSNLSQADLADLKEALDLLVTIYEQKGMKDKATEYKKKFDELSK